MFLALSLAGLVGLLLVAALSVAWLALPGGRFCPRCGGPTHPVRLRQPLRPLRRLLQWRWCADCGWEGLGRPPKAPDPGEHFRWSRPDPRRSPVFQWRDDEENPAEDERSPWDGEPRTGRPETPGEGTRGPEAPPGFRWKPPEEAGEPRFHWGGGEAGAGRSPEVDGVLVRFLRWLRKGDDGGFHRRDPPG